MYNTEHLQEKWGPILDYDGLDPIKDAHRRSVTAILLENQEKELREEASFLSEQPTVNTQSGANAGFSACLVGSEMCIRDSYNRYPVRKPRKRIKRGSIIPFRTTNKRSRNCWF